MAPVTDHWAAWILERRFGGDESRARAMLEELASVRDQILAQALLDSDRSLLDVGCGDGLIGFGALAAVPGCFVIFSDVSESLLAECRRLAESAGVADRCRFAVASADDLSEIEAASVDAVTTRSVLIYVEDKRKAFKEFHRVLRPGGRISVSEPINRYFLGKDGLLRSAFDPGPIKDAADKVSKVFMHTAPAPMMDFDERSLVDMVEQAGFRDVHLRLHVDVQPAKPQGWDGFYRSSPNPLAPTIEEAASEVLTPDEVRKYVDHFRPLVEEGIGTTRRAIAYVWATK